jgi:hypothetical protein
MGVAVAIVVALVVVMGGKDEAAAGEIFLESASAPGRDQFTPNVAAALPTVTPTTATATTSPPSGQTPEVPRRAGDTPGLYGGTRDNSSCDAARMVEFLTANPDKARAWASVLRIAPAGISAYVARLTPVVLREDTRVTNHGFRNGRATSLQAVLQAGTAVLVDDRGIPRVRCACGNPLTEPVAVRSTPRYTGTRWTSFNPVTIVVINRSTTVINNFTLIDLDSGDEFVRPAGGALSGIADGEGDVSAAPSPTPQAQLPSSLQDVVGTYGNVRLSGTNDCGGLTAEGATTFAVTVADPARGVVTIAGEGQTWSGTLAPDYSFRFTDESSGASFDGRFSREGGTVVMSGSVDLDVCVLTMTADRVG